jgi:hypothetical protein
MLEISIASVATLMAVFVIHLHGRWMFDAPVPIWLLKLTRTKNQKKENKNVQTHILSTVSSNVFPPLSYGNILQRTQIFGSRLQPFKVAVGGHNLRPRCPFPKN